MLIPRCALLTHTVRLILIVLKWPTEAIMIRERVSTNGVLRPLEPESEIPILTLPSNRLGRINEGVARRYLKGQGLWAKKFGQTAKKIETLRKKNLEAAKCETISTVESIVSPCIGFPVHLETDGCLCLGPTTRASISR